MEWHPPLVELGDESAQGSQTAGEPLYTLDIAYRAHAGHGHDLFGVGLDAMLGHNVSKQLTIWNPEKIMAISNMGPICNVRDMQRLIGCRLP